MIAKLRGLVDSTGEDWAVVDVSGVGYHVFCSGRTLSRLTPGETVVLVIETHVREDHIHLYGFFDEAERQWFRLLTTVQGVGSRVALNILTVLAGDELVHAIAAGDRTAVSRAAGVGPKLAARVVSELKDKAGAIALGPAALGGGGAPTAAGGAVATETPDAVSALVNLGYAPSEALGAVSNAAGLLGPEAGVEALVRAALAALAPPEHGAREAG